MYVALATKARGEIKLQIGVTGGRFANMLDRGFGKRSTAKIGVEDHARSVDYRTQGISERLAKLVFHGDSQARQGKF